MTDSAGTARYAFEYPDEVVEDPHRPSFDLAVVNDEEAGVYEAIVGDREIAAATNT